MLIVPGPTPGGSPTGRLGERAAPAGPAGLANREKVELPESRHLVRPGVRDRPPHDGAGGTVAVRPGGRHRSPDWLRVVVEITMAQRVRWHGARRQHTWSGRTASVTERLSRRRGVSISAETTRKRPGGHSSTAFSLSRGQHFGKEHRRRRAARGPATRPSRRSKRISPTCRRTSAGSSGPGWPPRRATWSRWPASPSGPPARPPRPPSGPTRGPFLPPSARRPALRPHRRPPPPS